MQPLLNPLHVYRSWNFAPPSNGCYTEYILHRDKDEIRWLYLPSQLERKLQLCTWWQIEWKGWACSAPHPHQPGLIFPSWWIVRQKAAIATLCVPLCAASYSMFLEPVERSVNNWGALILLPTSPGPDKFLRTGFRPAPDRFPPLLRTGSRPSSGPV